MLTDCGPGLALLAIFAACRLPASRAGWREELLLIAPALVTLTLVSSQTGFNHHLRYVLPVVPFLYIGISRIAVVWTPIAPVAQAASLRMLKVTRLRILRALIVISFAWSIASSLWHYPHSLSYFNEAVGGPRHGHEHLVDSNIDWGQDLLYLKRWLDAHPEARPLGLAYFGMLDPRLIGIEFTLPPKGPVTRSDFQKPTPTDIGPRPGWYAVSVSTLRGLRFPLPDGQGGEWYYGDDYFAYFQRLRPVAMAGYSIYVYHVTLGDANVLRRDSGLNELPVE